MLYIQGCFSVCHVLLGGYFDTVTFLSAWTSLAVLLTLSHNRPSSLTELTHWHFSMNSQYIQFTYISGCLLLFHRHCIIYSIAINTYLMNRSWKVWCRQCVQQNCSDYHFLHYNSRWVFTRNSCHVLFSLFCRVINYAVPFYFYVFLAYYAFVVLIPL